MSGSNGSVSATTEEAGPGFVYDFSFADGMGPWTSWLSPSLIQNEDGDHASYVRLQAPGLLDPNHVDGIGALWLVSHLSAPIVGSPGAFDLRNAEIDITIRGFDFEANGAKLIFWVCTYLPEEDLVLNYPVGLQVTNWAYTAGDIAGQVTDEWQTVTVRLSDLEADWTYAGNNVTAQGDWASRYEYLDLEAALRNVDATLHLVMVTDSADQRPSGFLDIANITVKTHEAATPSSEPQPDLILHGVEDETLEGSLAEADALPGSVSYALVAGSAQNGTVEIDPATGAYQFTPTANYYGPTDLNGPASFRYLVTGEDGVSSVRTAYVFIAPINDAPGTVGMTEATVTAVNSSLSYTLFKGTDVDGDILHFSLVEGSAVHGTVEIDALTGRYVFTPSAGFVGEACFQYVVSDGQLDSAPKTVVIQVLPGDRAVLPSYSDIIDLYLAAGDIPGFARWAIRLADAGDPNASYHYGTWLKSGYLVTQDTSLAARYLAQAVGVVPDATLQLAMLYIAGDGVARDYGVARALLESLPDSAEAHYRLGLLDATGFGAVESQASAVGRFITAARLGSGEAAFSLGRSYLLGDGVVASDADAYFWIGVAKQLGGGPNLGQYDMLVNYNMQQAAAGLTADQLAALDAAIASWAPGQPTPINDTPQAAAEPESATGPMESDVTGMLLQGNDSDGDLLVFQLVDDSATNGRVEIDARTGAFSFRAEPSFVGQASFQYRLFDGQDWSDVKTVTLTILPVTKAKDDAGLLDEDASVIAGVASGVLANDFSIDGGSLLVTAVNADPAKLGVPIKGLYGTLTLNADGSYTYVADQAGALSKGNQGVDSFVYQIRDSAGAVSSASLTFTITGRGGVELTGGGVLIGSTLSDWLTGSVGVDYLIGLDGDDVLDGGGDAPDTLQGGRGNDSYYITAFGDTIVELAGEGTDTILTSLSVYTLVANVENLVFIGSGAFDGIGNSGDNVITGGSGDDRLQGLGGNNVLEGGAGNDTADYSAATMGIYGSLNSGIVTINGHGGSDRLSGIENVTGSAFSDTIVGSAGANRLMGGKGSDYLLGLDGDDVLDGGGDAPDTLQGGRGNDSYYITAPGDTIIELAGEGTDTILTSLSVYTLVANVENLLFTGGGPLIGRGNAQANLLSGGSAADFLAGEGGDDILIGAGGSDELFGGAGADQFRYAGGEIGLDRIYDFVSGTDKIALSSAAFGHTPGIAFVQGAGAVANTANSTFLYDPATGIVSYDADGTGAGAALQIAQLNIGQSLAATDLIFY